MRALKNLSAVVFALLLVSCAAGWFLTRDAKDGAPAAKPNAASVQSSLVDQRLIRTAQAMSALADTEEEQGLAREALRLTDHELDQAFATALRAAATANPGTQGPAAQLSVKVAQLQARVAASQQRIAQLTKDSAADAQVELAKAQLALDEDELEDAQGDLGRQGGDEQSKLKRALAEHEDTQQKLPQVPKVASAELPSALGGQVRLWVTFRERGQRAADAQQEASRQGSMLERAHNTLEDLLEHKTSAAPADDSAEDAEDTASVVARLQKLSDQRKTLAELDRRIQDCQELAGVYQRWGAALDARKRAILHLGMRGLGAIFGILLAVLLLDRTIHHAFRRLSTDHRRAQQLRMMAGIGVRLVAVVIILLIVLGVPTQLTTIIGLATAGLTVVMKDFIVAFFGWFVLMGRNGVHLGDWVEIEGVGGEVIEIGVLKTVLLEMGNWTDTGHPTGRHVAFVNSFAIEGHYFNFSTAGQWLWDELQVMLPPEGDAYQMAEEIRRTVERETEEDARQAELDWQRVTHRYGTRTFSAKPAVDLKPSVNRLDVNVRYITRAPQRYEVKSRLFEKIVEMLHSKVGGARTA